MKLLLHFHNNKEKDSEIFQSAARHQYQSHDDFDPLALERISKNLPLFESILKKLSGVASGDIYFILYRDICLYRNEDDEIERKIPLREIVEINEIGSCQFRLTIRSAPENSTTMILEAANKELREEWISVINYAIDNIFSCGDRVQIIGYRLSDGFGHIQGEKTEGRYPVKLEGLNNELSHYPLWRLESAPIISKAYNLVVKVFEGRNLMDMDVIGLSDPFLKIRVIDVNGKDIHLKKTPVIKNNLNPIFDVVDIITGNALHNLSILQIEVWDKDWVVKDDFLGQVSWNIDLFDQDEVQGWQKLVFPEKNCNIKNLGELRVEITSIDRANRIGDFDLTIISDNNVPKMDSDMSGGKCDRT